MKKKNKSDKKYLLITIIVICLLLIGGFFILINQNNNPHNNNNSISNEVVKPTNPEQNKPIVNQFEQEVASDEDKKNDMKKILKELQKGTRKIITKTNEYTFDEYLSNNFYGEYERYRYVLIDLDDDGVLEIVVCNLYSTVIILNYENNVVYGYDDIMLYNLKVDGTFEGRTDENGEAIIKLETNKDEYRKVIKAYATYHTVLDEEYSNFYNDWNKTENAKYVYVYNNNEYQETAFEIKNNLTHKNKNRIEKLAYIMLDIINGPKYGSGASYCGELDFEDDFTIESEDSYNYYVRSKTYNSLKDLNSYWKKSFSTSYLKTIKYKFVEKNNKLYCDIPAKDGGSIYDKDKTRFKVLSENNNEMIVIGRVWTKESPDNAFSSVGYFDIILKLIKNDEGILVIDDYVRFI